MFERPTQGSQASPKVSKSASTWSASGTEGQMSQMSATPSPSVSARPGVAQSTKRTASPTALNIPKRAVRPLVPNALSTPAPWTCTSSVRTSSQATLAVWSASWRRISNVTEPTS
jgi:hypothetical protein